MSSKRVYVAVTAPPRHLMLLRWGFTAVTLASAFRVRYLLFPHAYGVRTCDAQYHRALPILLMCVACVFAWRKEWRQFVLLAIASQLASAFYRLYVVAHHVCWPDPYWRSPGLLFGLGVNTAEFALAAGLAVYMTRAYVSVRPSTSVRPADSALLKWTLVAATLVVIFVGLQVPIPTVNKDYTDFTSPRILIVLFPTAAACALAWLGRWREGVLFGVASLVVHAYLCLDSVAPCFFLRVPDYLREGVVGHVVEAIVAAAAAVHLSRKHVLVRVAESRPLA